MKNSIVEVESTWSLLNVIADHAFRFLEQPTPKCYKYWPSIGNSIVYQDIKVDNLSEVTLDEPGISQQFQECKKMKIRQSI